MRTELNFPNKVFDRAGTLLHRTLDPTIERVAKPIGQKLNKAVQTVQIVRNKFMSEHPLHPGHRNLLPPLIVATGVAGALALLQLANRGAPVISIPGGLDGGLQTPHSTA